MAYTINYKNYPPVIKYMGREYIGGTVTSGGSGGGHMDLLAESSNVPGFNPGTDVTLDGDMTEYDLLLFDIVYSNGAPMESSICTPSQIKYETDYSAWKWLLYGSLGYVGIYYVDDSTIHIHYDASLGIKRIYGIKL